MKFDCFSLSSLFILPILCQFRFDDILLYVM